MKHLLLCIFTLLVGAACRQQKGSFKPGEIWPDNRGVHINAHGGGLLQKGETYYWFGEHKTEGTSGNVAQVGVHCYSSTDLYHWKDEGVVFVFGRFRVQTIVSSIWEIVGLRKMP